MVQSVAEEIGLDIDIFDGIIGEVGRLGDVQNIKERLEEGSIDVIVSRGGTAQEIARNYDYPVVTISSGSLDLIECCNKAKQFSSNLVITSATPLVGLGLLENVLGVTISGIVIKDFTELENQIAYLANGDYCVIGGGPSILYAKKYGIPNVFLHTSRDTVRDALLRAKELSRLRHEVNRRSSRLQAILKYTNVGIIAIDEEEKIDIFNGAAEKILGVNACEALGQKVTEVIPNTRLQEVLADGQAQINEIQSIGDVRIITNRVPIYEGEVIVGAVATFQETSNIIQAVHQLRKEEIGRRFLTKYTLSDVLGKSHIIKMKKELAEKFALSDLTVFIYGPSGTGKELFAQGIHRASKRADGPFVAVNCGALPESLLESELFGYAEGAFTGAKRKGKAGLFELAHGGTIFLDEIEAMPIDVQGRLLRVLQEREVFRVGGESVISLDIRVIAATNKLPQKLLTDKAIREDLFYRLNVLRLDIPPLINRKEDIPLLCQEFLPKDKRQQARSILEKMMPSLQEYPWPGNVRELINFVQRLGFFLEVHKDVSSEYELLLNVMPELLQNMKEKSKEGDLRQQMGDYEEAKIVEALNNSDTLVEAAASLGIGKTTLWRKMKKISKNQ
ncbi:MAG: Sigma54 specific transcriptional regulator, Fis family [Clostridiales bacterium 38_11]|nr:MAG: Sigma54 specific transcriptional regulator, Fis family [Clostridiales bacterium 38_11]